MRSNDSDRDPAARPSRGGVPWLKLLFLGLLAWFVAGRVDLADRLVLSRAADAPPSFELVTRSGEHLTLSADDALPVEVVEEPGAPLEVWVRVEGGRLEIDPRLVGEQGPLAIQPGLRRALRAIRPRLLLLAFAVYAPVNLILAWRWGLLLRAAGISIRWLATVRLTWIGLFFNIVVPGGAGGDVIKVVELRRYSTRQSEAVGTVLVDRVVGLLVLVGLGVFGSVAMGSETRGAALAAAGFGALLVGGGLLYTSGWLRRRIDVAALLSKLPLGGQLRRLDEAVLAMGRAPGTLAAVAGLSLAAQLTSIVAAYQAARALGLSAVTLLDLVKIVPVAFAANAVPISPGGLGLLEVAFQELLYRQGLASLAAGFMLGVLVRALIAGWSLPGLPLWLAAGRSRAPRPE